VQLRSAAPERLTTVARAELAMSVLSYWQEQVRQSKARAAAEQEAERRRRGEKLSAGIRHVTRSISRSSTESRRSTALSTYFFRQNTLPSGRVSDRRSPSGAGGASSGGAPEMRGASWVTLRRPALLTLPNGQIGFFVHRKAAHALDASLVFAAVTAIEEQHELLDRLAVLMRRLRRTDPGEAAIREAARRRESCFAPALLRAEYFCAPLGDAPIRAEDVVRDAGWARVVGVCALRAEAEARVLLRLRAAAAARAGAAGDSKWATLRDRWRRNEATLTSSHGVTHAELVESTPFRPLRNPRRLFFVWGLALGAIACSSVFIVLYSLAPCGDAREGKGLCLSDPSSWNAVSAGWGIGLLMEVMIDDPLFIGVSLLLRTYFPVLVLYELIFKNRHAVACLEPISRVYDSCGSAISSCLGM